MGGIPYRYSIRFDGQIILANNYRAQTNNQASFSFEITLALGDETEKLSEQVLEWSISPVQNDRTLPLFSILWTEVLRRNREVLSQTILLPSSHILTISKEGSRFYFGSLLEVFLPAAKKGNGPREERFYFPYLYEGAPHQMDIQFTGWDFFSHTPQNDLITRKLATQEELISKIYQSYAQKNKEKKPALFWIQNTSAHALRPPVAPREIIDATGIYQIGLQRHILEEAIILFRAGLPVSLDTQGARSQWHLSLDGIFHLEEIQ